MKTALWWLLGAVCLLAAAGCLLTGNYRSAPCYLVVAAVSLPPVARRLHWKMPDSWRYFLILLGLMGAALLANPPDSLQAPQGKEAVAEPGPGGKGRQP